MSASVETATLDSPRSLPEAADLRNITFTECSALVQTNITSNSSDDNPHDPPLEDHTSDDLSAKLENLELNEVIELATKDSLEDNLESGLPCETTQDDPTIVEDISEATDSSILSVSENESSDKDVSDAEDKTPDTPSKKTAENRPNKKPSKNSICNFYKRGHCRFGADCRYKHVEGKQICVFYEMGDCKFGNKCRNLHTSAPVCKYYKMGVCKFGRACQNQHDVPLHSASLHNSQSGGLFWRSRFMDAGNMRRMPVELMNQKGSNYSYTQMYDRKRYVLGQSRYWNVNAPEFTPPRSSRFEKKERKRLIELKRCIAARDRGSRYNESTPLWSYSDAAQRGERYGTDSDAAQRNGRYRQSASDAHQQARRVPRRRARYQIRKSKSSQQNGSRRTQLQLRKSNSHEGTLEGTTRKNSRKNRKSSKGKAKAVKPLMASRVETPPPVSTTTPMPLNRQPRKYLSTPTVLPGKQKKKYPARGGQKWRSDVTDNLLALGSKFPVWYEEEVYRSQVNESVYRMTSNQCMPMSVPTSRYQQSVPTSRYQQPVPTARYSYGGVPVLPVLRAGRYPYTPMIKQPPHLLKFINNLSLKKGQY